MSVFPPQTTSHLPLDAFGYCSLPTAANSYEKDAAGGQSHQLQTALRLCRRVSRPQKVDLAPWRRSRAHGWVFQVCMWLLPAQTGGMLRWLWPVHREDTAAWLMPSSLGSVGGSCGGCLGSAAWVVLQLETAKQTERAARCGAPLGGSESEQASLGKWVNCHE